MSQDNAFPGGILPPAVRAQLEKILFSSVFANSERLRRFLRFAVEEALQGKGDQIKEYRIGTEVFDRNASYDPRIDPIVRVEASRLRGKLREYYQTDGAADPVIIELPKGGYTPVFLQRGTPSGPSERPATQPGSRAIAVLPFVDMSAPKDQDYFCDGMTEELIHALAQVEELRVVARTSAFEFKGCSIDVRELGRRLNVGSIVEGSVRRIGGRIRVTAQLIDSTNGFHLWSGTLDREVGDVFAIQEEISQAIVGALRIRFRGGGGPRLVKAQTQDVEAYELYLKGRYHWNKQRIADIKKGIEFFEQAIERAPQYARAWAGLGHCYSMLGLRSLMPSTTACAKAKVALARSLAIDSREPEAQVTMAGLRAYYDWDWQGADADFRRITTQHPGFEDAHHAYAWTCLVPLGRFEEAAARMLRAQEIDPLSAFIANSRAGLYSMSRQFEECVRQCRATLEVSSNSFLAHWNLANGYRGLSRFEEAIAELELARSLGGDFPVFLSDLAHLHALRGAQSRARELVAEIRVLSGQRYVSPEILIPVLLALGEREQALAKLEEAYRSHSPGLVYCKVDSRYDPLRGEPAFTRVLQGMNLA